MVSQLPLLEADSTESPTGLVTSRHINYDIGGSSGIQDVQAVPGLQIHCGIPDYGSAYGVPTSSCRKRVAR